MRRADEPTSGRSGGGHEFAPRSPVTRRRALLAGGAALAVGLAGCTVLTDDRTPADQSFERLHLTAVYVHEDVDLAVPDDVPTVRAMTNADLLVLPGDSDADAEQVVEWLADERVLALLGDAAEGTWLAWARSEAFDEHFERRGSSDAEPDPDLLVAAAVGLDVPTYRHSWSDGPRDRDVLRALDEILIDLEQRTPS